MHNTNNSLHEGDNDDSNVYRIPTLAGTLECRTFILPACVAEVHARPDARVCAAQVLKHAFDVYRACSSANCFEKPGTDYKTLPLKVLCPTACLLYTSDAADE